MIKVLEHGYRYHMETRCPSCGCRFSYEWEDVIKKDSSYTHLSDGQSSAYYWAYPAYQIICPECGSQFDIMNWSINYPPDKGGNINPIWTCAETDAYDCKCTRQD